jgi:hypothetical protein
VIEVHYVCVCVCVCVDVIMKPLTLYTSIKKNTVVWLFCFVLVVRIQPRTLHSARQVLYHSATSPAYNGFSLISVTLLLKTQWSPVHINENLYFLTHISPSPSLPGP